MNEAQSLLSMPGVGFLGMLIIGILAGYVAEKATGSNHGLTNPLVGIAGSFVGGPILCTSSSTVGWAIWLSRRSARLSCCGFGGDSVIVRRRVEFD
jgi:uncharacterized membrane protein YeaQ/YmgE (transglycosylase-associated protein family)